MTTPGAVRPACSSTYGSIAPSRLRSFTVAVPALNVTSEPAVRSLVRCVLTPITRSE
jgi:hypothetical protein